MVCEGGLVGVGGDSRVGSSSVGGQASGARCQWVGVECQVPGVRGQGPGARLGRVLLREVSAPNSFHQCWIGGLDCVVVLFE